MTSLQLAREPVVRTQMLIRAPVAKVFQAFVDPAITSKFWFTGGSGRLEPGKRVQWDWEMYGVSAQVDVKAVEENKRIRIEWGSANEVPTAVEWVFTDRGNNETLVVITNRGFTGKGDEVVDKAIDSMGGFSFVLAGLKAYLEHDIALNLVADAYPDGVV